MGARIIFYTANNDLSFLENFVNDYQDFREWTLDNWQQSELKDHGQLIMGMEISISSIDYLNKNRILNLSTTPALMDELLAIYFISFCDHGNGKKLYELTGPMMNKWRYEKSTKLVNKTCNEKTKKLWNKLNLGCSSNPELDSSQSFSKDIIVGWWNVDEMREMKANLSKAFPCQIHFDNWDQQRQHPYFHSKEPY